MQLCNLTSCVAREDDTVETLREKIRIATIIGTIQSSATYFPGLRREWRENCEEERLLGVDITGQMDCLAIRDASVMDELRQYAVKVNQEYAHKLRINPSVAVTTVKPSGNTSVLVNCASGLHPRWSEYYVRNVRVSSHSPLYKVLRDAGVPLSPENGQESDTANTWVASFPIKSPQGAITRKDVTALDQLNHWLLNKEHWTEHNPSCTITYKADEIIDVVKWAWEHRHMVGGLSFLPYSESSYRLMPYEEIDRDTYEKFVTEFPPIDFSRIYRYEEDDLTTASSELACVSGTCETDYSK